MSFQKANNSYNASLTSDYGVGDGTLGVNSVPSNFPTIISVARGTSKETRFYVTGGGSGLLTGVTRLDGANENISAGVSVECMIDAEFINQLSSAIYTQPQLKDLTYAVDGGATDAYAITLPVAPASFSDITGLPISFKANTINTGPATLNVNGLGAIAIKKNFDEDLADGDLQAGQVVTVIYDGTVFQIQLASSSFTKATGAEVDTGTDDAKFVTAKALVDSSMSSGWTPVRETWTYASASTFTIAGVDRTAIYTVGTRLRFKQGGGYKYAVVASSAFSTDTTVTIVVNTDYVIANAAITDNYYSYQANPQGYPGWFNYTPTFGGFSVDPTGTGMARYSITGRTCTVMKTSVTPGTSNANTFTMTAPVATPAATSASALTLVRSIDNGASIITSSAYLGATSNVITFEKTSGAPTGWTSSGNKDAYATVSYEI